MNAGSTPVTLVCFAVEQEAKPVRKLLPNHPHARVTVTGMGARNAERAIRAALSELRPSRVFTCGFAGALNPGLVIGEVVCPREAPVAGATPAVFLCASRVAVTAAEKTALRARSGADVVEMESGVIARVCAGAGVPCLTVRVISDTAHEDLPLDFNALMTAGGTLGAARLALAILGAPHRIPALMRLGRNSSFAAARLAGVLAKVI